MLWDRSGIEYGMQNMFNSRFSSWGVGGAWLGSMDRDTCCTPGWTGTLAVCPSLKSH